MAIDAEGTAVRASTVLTAVSMRACSRRPCADRRGAERQGQGQGDGHGYGYGHTQGRRERYGAVRGVKVNFCPAMMAAYISPPFATVKTAMPAR